MPTIDASFSTDKFIERACLLILVLLSTVTVFACVCISSDYGIGNEIRLLGVPVSGALIYLLLSFINKSLSISNYIRNSISAAIAISNYRLNRMIRAIKLSLLVTITFRTIAALDKLFNIKNDLQDLCTISEIILMIIPILYILVQLRKAGQAE